MSEYSLRIKLESDTTFGRGDGIAGLVDSEVEHDENGLPFLRGRTLRGLLSEECANLLFVINQFPISENLQKIAENLFGRAGSTLQDDGKLHIGNAVLAEDLRKAVKFQIEDNKKDSGKGVSAKEVLDSLTTIRRQTRINEKGSPEKGSLRSSRVILRETEFVAELLFAENPTAEEIMLLGLSAKSLQRVGLGRNRGRGKVSVKLLKDGKDLSNDILTEFSQMLPEDEK